MYKVITENDTIVNIVKADADWQDPEGRETLDFDKTQHAIGHIRQNDGTFTPPPEPLKTKDELKSALAAYRYQVETGGITINGMTIQTDRESRANIMGARIAAKENSQYTVTWKTAEGFQTLDAATIISVADAVRQHVEAAFAAEATVQAEIEDGVLTTTEQVQTRFDNIITA